MTRARFFESKPVFSVAVPSSLSASPLTKGSYIKAIAAVWQGVLLCSKKLCPHCNHMEKVMEKFSGQRPKVSLFKLNSEEEPEVMAALGIERAPTVIIIKNGKRVYFQNRPYESARTNLAF